MTISNENPGVEASDESDGDDFDSVRRGPRERVYVIESPSAQDLLQNQNEGDAIQKFLHLAGLEVNYYLAINVETFKTALEFIGDDIKVCGSPKAQPFIHISAHGSEDGIELADEDIISWEKLNQMLGELHRKIGPMQFPSTLGGRKIMETARCTICLSSCSAFKAYVKNQPDFVAYQSIVGPTKDVGWCESLIAFSTFYYHHSLLGKGYADSCSAMNTACGSDYNKIATFEYFLPKVFEDGIDGMTDIREAREMIDKTQSELSQ